VVLREDQQLDLSPGEAVSRKCLDNKPAPEFAWDNGAFLDRKASCGKIKSAGD